ncbi:hypothetical protein TcYC6_0033810 [Trypanosoma cruzi]|nr:hypothetical protein TcYC6_0033810 [Trypanosoma cruzi]
MDAAGSSYSRGAFFLTRSSRACGIVGDEVWVRLVGRTTPCGSSIKVASAWAVQSVAEVRSVPSLALVLAQVVGGGSGEIPGRSDSPGKLNFRSAWEHVMPWALTMCITTPVRHPRRTPTAFAGIAVCSGRSSHPHLCETPAEAGQCGLFPTSEGGVRARGFPVACYGGAVSHCLEPSDTNNTFGQCDDAGGQCACELCEVGCLLGFSITSFVPGHAALAKDKLHSCVRSSALRARQKGTSTM